MKNNLMEVDFLESRDARESVMDNTDVLDKVGNLLLLPSTSLATMEQVAEYYGVPSKTMGTLVTRNKVELEDDGIRLYKKSEAIELLSLHHEGIESVVGKSMITLKSGQVIDVPNRGLRLFTKRSILRVGMLLRDSEIAREIRTRLLDIVHDTQKKTPEIIQNVVNEISMEKQLMLDRVEAEMNGDYDEVFIINAKLISLKNRRIEELEVENNAIKSHALTITDSRKVINKIVRSIASKEYGSMFGQAWTDLYSQANYKLNINLKGRKKGKGETSMLSRLTDSETYELEMMARAWAVEKNLDLNSILSLAN